MNAAEGWAHGSHSFPETEPEFTSEPAIGFFGIDLWLCSEPTTQRAQSIRWDLPFKM